MLGKNDRTGDAAGLRAIILAGGKGTRLQPFTISFPKPLVPLGDRPIIEILIRRLIRFGVQDITLTLGHLAELIKAYFQHRQCLTNEARISFVEEEQPTGTAGSLSLVPGLNETFLVMNGDLLTDLDFDALIRFHRENGAMLTVATHKRSVKVDLGVIEFDDQHQITTYIEKPTTNYYVSMGVYVYEPAVLGYIKRAEYLDFPELVLQLLRAGERVCSYPTDCQWLDIGRPDDYAQAQRIFEERVSDFDCV